MKKQRWSALCFLALIQGMVFLDNAIVTMALPSIQRDLQLDMQALQWIISAYTLSFGGLLLLGGRIADLFGHRRTVLWGLTGFILSSIGIALSTSGDIVIICRTIQGVAAAFMTPAAFALVLIHFEHTSRPRALAVWSMTGSAGGALGLSLGGIVTEQLGWPAIFFISVPLGIVAFIGIAKTIPHTPTIAIKHCNWIGASLLAASLTSMVFTLTTITELGFTQPASIMSSLVNVICLLAFVIHEKLTTKPFIPLQIFRYRDVISSNLAMIGVSACLYSMLFFATLYVQNILQYSPAQSGVCFLLFPLLVVVSSSISPLFMKKLGVKMLMLIGITLVSSGVYTMTFITPASTFFGAVFPGLGLMASGLGMTYLAINTAATRGVRSEFSGVVSGLIATSQQIGSALGLALVTGLATSTVASALQNGFNDSSALTQGYKAAFFGSTLCAFFALIAAGFVRHRNQKAITSPILIEEKV